MLCWEVWQCICDIKRWTASQWTELYSAGDNCHYEPEIRIPGNLLCWFLSKRDGWDLENYTQKRFSRALWAYKLRNRNLSTYTVEQCFYDMCNGSCSEAGLKLLMSCIGCGRANQEVRWLQSLLCLLRSGEWDLLAQHLLAGLRYTHPLNLTPIRVTGTQGRAETFGGAGAQNIKGAHETRL